MSRISEIVWLDNTEKNRVKYNAIFDEVALSNIPQAWDYGIVKQNSEKSGLLRGLIKAGNCDAGVVQILFKKKKGITIAARINRGPLFLKQYDNAENHFIAMEKVRKKIPHPIPIIYAPNIENSPENIAGLAYNRWKQWDCYGYETGIIDLENPLEDIRKQFDSKWRNQLKSSEKYNLEIKNDFSRFEEILCIYEESQKDKRYEGIPRSVLCGLKQLKKNPLDVFYIVNDSKDIIAFDIFYSTNNFGLYFVGWNDGEGRRMYVNNLLLYHAICVFKERGVKWFDLGGIDYIDTEENARFKDGMRPYHIRYAGEFVKF